MDLLTEIEKHIIKDETLKSANSLEDIAKNLEKTAENEKLIYAEASILDNDEVIEYSNYYPTILT